MFVHEAYEIAERMLGHYRVGVEQQHILAGGQTYGLVVGTGKAHVFLVLHEGHLREPLAEVGNGVVGRQVVDYVHLYL